MPALLAFDMQFLISTLVVILAFVFVHVVVSKTLKISYQTLFLMLVNSVTSIIGVMLLNAIGIGVPVTLPVMLPVALFGIPALCTILILMFFGVIS
ncbi:hypothetical protein H0N99_00605 [Candidatus Micrarchaeota archaeon]|nr:hypothetical protein [Candidatus Micrarchaeota archaeon]